MQQTAEEERLQASTTAVAIDRDRNSQHAVKWAVEHLLANNPHIILIHVRCKSAYAQTFIPAIGDGGGDSGRDQTDQTELQQLYLPFRGFCARKGVTVTEVVLKDMDISQTLVEYITNNCIHNIVVGASGRNAFTRKFKNPDVPTSLTKAAPDFCTVYVISKGKVTSVRSAIRPAPPPAPVQPPAAAPQPVDDAVKTPFARAAAAPFATPAPPLPAAPSPPLPPALATGWRSPAPSHGYWERRMQDRGSEFPKSPMRLVGSARNGTPEAGYDFDGLLRPARSSQARDSLSESFDVALSSDYSDDSLEFSASSPTQSPRSSISSLRDAEAEMKRLKLELKQTMDMYSNARREAMSAKQQAQEYQEWKMEEARKLQEARQNEAKALAVAEMEKAKCKAAMQAAQKAQRLAEIEAQRRKSAEMKARKAAEEKKRALDTLANNDVRYRKYTIEEIEAATDFFSGSLKIGEGGYGPVYRATLDHTAVAIKVLRPDAAQGRKQFQQEVEILSCIRHPNMVLLLGACPEYGCLVYEYMDNGSLEDRLFCRGNTSPIPWRTRFKIAGEIATALLFLHQSKPEPLVHRDLKPANILLDRNYVSKISDVGLARLVPASVADSVTQYRMTSTAGTFCYIDPEYQQTGMLGIKSDIYSLGIMLLQIITAKPPMGLTHHVQRAIDKGTFADMLDPAVGDWPVEEALAFAKMALKCAELKRKDRPDLGSVILPELNRLRKLGSSADEASIGSSTAPNSISSGYSYSSRSGTNPRSRGMISSPLQASSPFRSSSSTEESGTRIPSGYSNGGRPAPRRMAP